MPLHDDPNWSTNVYNLVTKRAAAHEGATMEWIDGNIGSKVTMKYPSVWLLGEHAKGEVLSVAFAGERQHQDAGAKMVHVAPEQSSQIVSKSVRGAGDARPTAGSSIFRRARAAPGPRSSATRCSWTPSAGLTRPLRGRPGGRRVDRARGDGCPEVGEDQLFDPMSRGLSEDEAMAMVVRGFVEPIARELPMEYAV